MDKEYKIKELTIEELYVNPDNARFINADELPDEVAAIRELTLMYKSHICKLAKDISVNGLNPNELPIVVPGPERDGRYLVMEGNRRITSIKLMTQYKKSLDKIGINSGQKKALAGLQCGIKTVFCVLYDDESKVNALIEKIHTSKPGIGRVNWDGQAQDRHQFKCGSLSRRFALIEMLRCSQYTSDKARSILRKHGWVSKLLRFVRNDVYMLFFGIRFDDNNNILLNYEESEVIKGLSQLVIDLDNTVAAEIAQTEAVRQTYIDNFPPDTKLNREKINNPLVLFNVETKEFEITDIVNDINSKSMDESIDANQNQKTEDSQNTPPSGGSLTNRTQPANMGTQGGGNTSSASETEDGSSSDSRDSYYKSTLERTTLIPKDENIPIKNQRTLDLYNELKLINIGKYTNVVSIAFRSLIEFSINCFLDSKNNKLAFNEQISFYEKLEKVIRILESIYTKQKLENELHAIYRSMDTFASMGKKCDLNSIPHLHVLIHSHNYHPIDKELKLLYNNYSPLLRLIWENVSINN